MSKEDKENAVGTTKKNARKKWDLNPDLSVLLPPWNECDGSDCNSSENIPPASAKSSSTFIICKEDSASATEEEVNKVPYKKTTGNHGPNNVTFTKVNDKKDGRRSLQVVAKVTAENKKKIQQRRSDVRKVATKPASVAGLPQRRLTLKKSTSTALVQQQGVKNNDVVLLNIIFTSQNHCLTLVGVHYMMNIGVLNKKEVKSTIYKGCMINFNVAFTKWLNYMLAPLDCYGNTLPTNGKKGN